MPTAAGPSSDDRVEWLRLLPFVAMHLACLLVLWTGVSPVAIGVAVLLYAVRMFGITAFYHRYFAHRSFVTSRAVQFAGAVLGAAAAQRGPLWWAAHHRRHHRHADTPADSHSPLQRGFWWAHVGWFTTKANFHTDHGQVRDLGRFPELRFLDRFDVLVPLALLLALGGLGWWLDRCWPELGTDAVQMMVVGFCISTTVLFHATAAVNSCGHLFGRKVWPTDDDSRNSLWLALLTFGEGWHNNHHWCPGSVRQGFRWWQVDLSWYLLQVMAWLRLVEPLRPLPQRVRVAARPPAPRA